MSLVNRMLKDLSARQPAPADVMQGIRIESAGPRPGERARRLLLLVVLGLLVGAGLWWWSGQFPRAASPAAVAPAAAPRPAAAVAAPASTSSAAAPRFRLDEILSEIPAPHTSARATPGVKPPSRSESAPAATRAASAAPNPGNAKADSAGAHYAAAVTALDGGDAELAEQHLTDALALDPKHHPSRELLGTIRVRQKRWAEAERSVRRGLQEDPDWIGYRRLAARLELAQDQPEKAVAELQSNAPAVAVDPEYNGLLASAYQRTNRHAEASRIYRDLAASEPEQGHWWAGYAISREALGDRDEALKAYTQALRCGDLDERVSKYASRRIEALKKGG